MKSYIFLIAAASLAAAFPANGQAAAPGHGGHGGALAVNQELIKGITPADFLRLGEKEKSAVITLVAVWSAANAGMNFNGYSHGKAIYTIPKDWSVEVRFINPSAIPHSVLVVERDFTKKMQMGEPFFPGASVPTPALGMSNKAATFTFVADEPGEFALACGFPAHAMSGHWLSLNVSEDIKVPTLQLGEDAKPVEAVK